MQCPFGDEMAAMGSMLRCPEHGMFVPGSQVRGNDRLVGHLDKIPEGMPATFACPDCGGAMRQLAGKKITIEQCTTCSGIWLDDGEEVILKRAERMDGWSLALAGEMVVEVALYAALGLGSLLG